MSDHKPKPYTKTELEAVKKKTRNAIWVHYAEADRLFATIEQGFAPDEPTSYQLSLWAAKEVMGWRSGLREIDSRGPKLVWLNSDGHIVELHDDWAPEEKWHDLIQVLEAAGSGRKWLSWRQSRQYKLSVIRIWDRNGDSRIFTSTEKALRWLHEELTE